MASHIPLVQDGALIGLDGKSLAPAPINAWSGFPFEVHPHMRKGEVAHRYNPSPLIVVRSGARGRSRIRSGPHIYELLLEPGQIDVFPVGFHMDHGWWDCTPGEVSVVELSASAMHGLLHDETAAVHLHTRLSGRDPVLERLIDCARLEIDSGCGSGKLYADGLSLAIVGCLRARHAEPKASCSRARALSPRQLHITHDFVQANLASDLRVAQLAELHDMSAYHFARLFKTTTGTTPHRFVTDQRIEAAQRLLAGTLPLAEIAFSVGFSSQSHFTEAFRKRMGRAPGRMRRSD